MRAHVKVVSQVVSAVVFLFLGMLVVLAITGCGAPKPPPVVPAGEVSCDEACRHVANDLPLCGTSERLCLDVCRGVARNNPKYPTCLARGRGCETLTGCDHP